MDDLVAFLQARLDEDEARASAALPRWHDDQMEWEDLGDEVYSHARWHDPARVLRDVAAKRAIVALHKTDIDPADALYGTNAQCEECGTYVVLTGPCKALRILATIHSGHLGYRDEWKS